MLHCSKQNYKDRKQILFDRRCKLSSCAKLESNDVDCKSQLIYKLQIPLFVCD